MLYCVVDAHGFRVDPEKVASILNDPSSTNVYEIRRLLGIVSWYGSFVPNFSSIVAPEKLLSMRLKFILYLLLF